MSDVLLIDNDGIYPGVVVIVVFWLPLPTKYPYEL